jgi:hypothetical protein
MRSFTAVGTPERGEPFPNVGQHAGHFCVVGKSGFPRVGHVRASEFIRPMRGRSEPWLVRCDDGAYYVVKFPANRQHVRILANEMLACRLAKLLGLPVAASAFVEFVPELAGPAPTPWSNVGARPERGAAILSFGSRFPGPPERTLVVDFLPDRLLSKVRNLVDIFVGGFVFDNWTCNCDGRQVVFFRSAEDAGRPYTGLLIDQGFYFNGAAWNFPDSPIRSFYPRRLVYDTVTSLESFEPFISRIESLGPTNIERCAADIPSEWRSPDPGELEPLLSRLYARGKKLRQLILEAKITSRFFRNWV